MKSLRIAWPWPGYNAALKSKARSATVWWLLPALGLACACVFIAGLGVGAVPISAGQTLSILATTVGLELPWAFTEREALVLLHIRAPRVMLGALTGAALALGGVVMQALFRNPLADPGLIGVSGGAAMAAAIATVFGAVVWPLSVLPTHLLLPLSAFFGGWGAVLLVLRLARNLGETRIEHVLLAGIAVNALAGAVIGLLMMIADDAQLREVAFWSFGSLGRADWSVLPIVALVFLPLLYAGMRFASWLNTLLLGEGEAQLLGVPVELVKRGATTLTCLAVGGVVAFTGLIGFIGLVTPHLIRLIAGPDHRILVPASALLGATLLPLADVLARTVAAPIELPIGLVTALIGAPFFLMLLISARHGGRKVS